ncbi:MAG: hypothetical protein ACI83O_000318 [Patescibacteria group bacterium]|jgi:hypothetical protein
MVVSNVPLGSIRILTQGVIPVVITGTEKGFKKCTFDVSHIEEIAHKYKAHANYSALVDPKDDRFLRGFLTSDSLVRGAKVTVMPDGQNLDKGYSLFSPHLIMHDEKNNTHWDVIFAQPNGKLAYLYTEKKIKESKGRKFIKVHKFGEYLPELEKKLRRALRKNDMMALPLYTLLKTYIRIGNEGYYNMNGHKGLTTLQRRDIDIDGDVVTFTFIAKDGVPQKKSVRFPKFYIERLVEKLGALDDDDFVFTGVNGHPLRDTQFEDAFEKYCGVRFYPHIVRSHYATSTVENFLQHADEINKSAVKSLYSHIAEELGHKKFSKKHDAWETSYTITVAHYISPELVELISEKIIS